MRQILDFIEIDTYSRFGVFHSQAIASKLTYEFTGYFIPPISQHDFDPFQYIIEKS